MAKDEPRSVAQNRKARHDYFIEDTLEAGMMLLGSEVKSLRGGRASIAEAFAVERDGPDAVCRIRDQGIGISPDDQQKLFNAFQRGDNVGDRPGTGLGLVLVKRCLELHGGQVGIESQVGQGTTVTVRFPVFETES